MSTHSCHWVQHKLQEWALWKAQLQMTYGETQPGQRPRDCISQMAYLLGKTGKKHLASKSLEPLAVCALAESSLSPRPPAGMAQGVCRHSCPHANAHCGLKAPSNSLGSAYSTATLRSLVLRVTHQWQQHFFLFFGWHKVPEPFIHMLQHSSAPGQLAGSLLCCRILLHPLISIKTGQLPSKSSKTQLKVCKLK